MGEREKTNLRGVVTQIQKKELLLPDFQRGFVWDLEMQRRLVASVLTRMPLGSILILDANEGDYGCRIIGRKDHVLIEEEDRKIQVLLDGQQRLTVLANIFSNLLYYDYQNPETLIEDYKNVISNDLKNRFFLRIPCIEKLTEKEDLFGLRNLKFALNSPNREKENFVETLEEEIVPQFLTEDIRDFIEVEGFDEESEESYTPHVENPLDIINDSIKGIKKEDYMIPLYLLINNRNKGVSGEELLNEILKSIVEQVVRYRYISEYNILEEESQKEQYIRKYINPIYQKDIWKEEKNRDDTFKKKWIEQGCKEWSDKMLQYLKLCINDMNLHQIIVPQSERERAIDIYENLNLGGITLSTFELILAKASKIKFEENNNLYEQMLGFVKEPKDYEACVLTEATAKYYEEYRKQYEDYSATDFMECYDQRKHEFRKKYTDIFLDVLSLLCYVPDYKQEKIETSIIKRDKILALKAELIHENYKQACIGIDRACFFLQARCGVRKIQEINYNLMVVLLGYILANDTFYQDKKIIERLEAWYWSSIFSGRYDKDQTEHMKEDICLFLKEIEEENQEQKWLKERAEKVFMIEEFSDEATILLETHTTPKSVLKTSICQFYLAQTYKDFLNTEKRIQPFDEAVKELQEHHIVPIGRLDTPYKQMADARKDKRNIFNSPVNFAYITKETNRKIQNLPYEVYGKYCAQEILFKLNLEPECETLEAEQVKDLLKKRLDGTKAEVKNRIEKML